jgi:DNA-binding NarL/FixJ family response regulator
MKALIVDDHPVSRRGLRTILTDAVQLEECFDAGSAGPALELGRRHHPDVVLLDMRRPDDMATPELCRQMRRVLPEACIVIVTAFDRILEIRDCLRAGANGCLLKDTSELDMTAALRSLIAGQCVIDPRIAQRLAAGLVGGRTAPSLRLTERERDVLDLIAEGRSNRAIATQLHVAEATVKGHVSSLLDKLGASSRLEAVVRASDEGLI